MGDMFCLFRLDGFDLPHDGFVVEVHVGNGGKQAVYDGLGGAFIRDNAVCRPCQPNQFPGECVLQMRGAGFFTAYTADRASGSFRRLLTLKTKH